MVLHSVFCYYFLFVFYAEGQAIFSLHGSILIEANYFKCLSERAQKHCLGTLAPLIYWFVQLRVLWLSCFQDPRKHERLGKENEPHQEASCVLEELMFVLGKGL